jgi:hypothetical protein
MASPLDGLNPDDVARYLAERNTRVYSLAQVAEMTGFALRTLERKCREGKIRHTWDEGRTRGMTLRQIDALVETFETGENERIAPADEFEDARTKSLRAASRRAPRAAA